MECKEAVKNLLDYIHNEMGKLDEDKLKEHLDECRKCCVRFNFEENFTLLLRNKFSEIKCPNYLKENIKKLIVEMNEGI
jgi:anti-sigma factor (TIGR02949 family)